jgi:hypothetical protein
MRCQACRRTLTNSTSLKFGLGPDCLRKAVKAGNAPLEALAELAEEKKKQPKRIKPVAQLNRACTNTPDLFDQPRKDAIGALYDAAESARSFWVRVQLEIEE